MKRRRLLAYLFLAATLGLAALLHAQESGVDIATALRNEVTRSFEEARKAYDDNRLDQAVAAYRHILNQGFVSEAVLFNLGNAYFRKGDLGHAILFYKRALYRAPRDPDARANLKFALDTAGVSPPRHSPWDRILGHVSLREWVVVALVGYWGAALCAGIYLWRRRRAPLLLRMAGVFLLVLLLGGSGVVRWLGLRRAPEVVVLEPNQQVLFAPLEGSTAHFAAPPGSILRVHDTSGAWLKVRSGKQGGWIKGDACEKVYPLQSPGT